MKHLLWSALIAATFTLSGCSRTNDKSGEDFLPANSAPPVLPVFSKAIKCLTDCRTLWFYRNGEPSPEYTVLEPRNFEALISDPSKLAAFEEMRRTLPNMAMGWFSRPTSPDKWHGGLTQIIKNENFTVYLYTGVSVFRYGAKNEGSLDLAFEPASGKMAAIANGGAELNQRYLIGSTELQPVIIAFSALQDLSLAASELHYAKIKDDTPYQRLASDFPAASRVSDATNRIQTMSSQLGATGQTENLAQPNDSIEAQKIRRERQWFAVGQSLERCVSSSMSPADRITIIREAGFNPTVQELKNNGAITRVDISTGDRVWAYWKNKDACERSLSNRTEIPDRYR